MGFGDITIDGLIATGALFSAISETEFAHIKQIAIQKILKEAPPPDF